MSRPRLWFLLLGIVIGAGLMFAARLLRPAHPLPRDELMSMRLDRTLCLGDCPSYTLIVHGNGDVEYVGRQFVRVTGRRTSRLDSGEVSALLRRFERADFLVRAESCDPLATDSAGVLLSLEMRGRTHRIAMLTACDQREVGDLLAIADVMDGVTDSAQWVGSRPDGRRE